MSIELSPDPAFVHTGDGKCDDRPGGPCADPECVERIRRDNTAKAKAGTEKLWTKMTPEDLVAIAQGDAETLADMLLEVARCHSVVDFRRAVCGKAMIAAIERSTTTRYDEATDDHYVTIPEEK